MSVDLVGAASLAAIVRKILASNESYHITLDRPHVLTLLSVLDNKIAASFRELNYKEKQQINDLVTVTLIKDGIMKIDNPIQPEITPASPACPEPFHWGAYDGVATEIEVLEFLYAFVRMVKPNTILETGTYLGHSAVYMALAQKQNGFGNLLSCDTDEEVLKRAVSLAMQNDIQQHISFMKREGIDVIKQMDERSLDLVFIDSGDEQTRKDEINAVLRKISYKGFLIVHDLNKLGSLSEHLTFLKTNNYIDGTQINCTPRGIGVFQVLYDWTRSR